MHITVISLLRATERRKQMEEQAAALGLTFDFLEAKDGRELTPAERALVDHKARKKITPYPLADGEIGCWISHLRAMKVLLIDNDPMMAILEDDAVLTPDFPRVLQAIEERGTPFDVIDLHRNFKKDEIFAPNRDLLPGFGLGRIGYMHMNLTGYVVSKEGARKFLSHAKYFAHAIDKELHRYWANGLDIYGLENPVATQARGGHSFIDETRAQDRPVQRPRYADADRLYWRFMRAITRMADSLRKKLAWPVYSRKGRK